VSAGLQGRSGLSTESIRDQALRLISKVLDGFEYHPYFFVLNARADPPAHPYAHQTELLFRAAFRRPVRLLIGDEIGLGKTVEAILMVKMLERRDGVKRVLILVPRILVEQWKSELKRFGIRPVPLERRDFDTYVKQGFPSGWYVASIDLAKREPYRSAIVNVEWDVIVVDEAHRVGKVRGGGRAVTQRFELVEELAKATGRHVILLSATPHRGYVEDYISRLKLVDPYLGGSERELDDESFYALTRDSIVVRRTKTAVNDVYEHEAVFRNARFVARVVGATQEEREFSRLLFEFLRGKLLRYYEYVGEEPRALPLLLTLIAKRASSSPRAAIVTLERVLQKRAKVVRGEAQRLSDVELDERAASIAEALLGVGFEDYGELDELEERGPDEVINEFAEDCAPLLSDEDVETLRRIVELARAIVERGDSRLRSVANLVQEHVSRGEKVVIFTEYKDTAEYVWEHVSKLPGVEGGIALVTSEEIRIPGWRGPRKPDIEDLKAHLRRGSIKVVVATDVASEGLNLQVANVLVNYEPTWSPVKVEQRLGRVWRLGQERDVVSYTVFLDVQSDKDVLDVLYRKILALGRSLYESRVPIGEEVMIDMMTESGPVTIPADSERGVPKYSEYKALLSYIRGGRAGLEEYVKSILQALESLRRSLERVGLAGRALAERTERLLRDVLGDFRGEGARRALLGLLQTVAELRGQGVVVRGGRAFVGTSIVLTVNDAYGCIKAYLPDAGGEPVRLVSSAQVGGLNELHLFRSTVLLDGKPVYSEAVGVGVGGGRCELIRGRRLLEVIAEALSGGSVLAAVHELSVPKDLMVQFKALAKSAAEGAVHSAVREFRDYVSRVERRGFSPPHRDWIPRPDGLGVYSVSVEYLGSVVFAAEPKAEGGAPPPAVVKEVEEAAMKAAMEYERGAGRVPEDVSAREHFDILSRDPRTGEIRCIEVKGRSGFDFEVELTDAEFQVAREKGEKYWLYIVYGIGSGNPRLLAIRDPVRNMRWQEIAVKRYRFRPE